MEDGSIKVKRSVYFIKKGTRQQLRQHVAAGWLIGDHRKVKIEQRGTEGEGAHL